MQPNTDRVKKLRKRALRTKVAWSLAAIASATTAASVMAASQTWTGIAGDGIWSTGGNWSGGAAPGAFINLNSDVATFNGPVGAASPILFENQRNIGSFLFDTADAGAYTFQHPGWDPNNYAALGYAGDGLYVTSTANPAGNITMNSSVVNAQVFNTPIVFRPANS